ncbi:MAG: Holliday junction resolvase RuvX [Magnetospirillum sp. WYHS-4]
MPVVDLKEMGGLLPPERRLMGLDVGSKTVGLALSDVRRMIASPLKTLMRTKFTRDAQDLAKLIAEFEVGGLVLGLPVGMDGLEGPRCQSVRQFAANLMETVDLPVAFFDERLSTAAVERILIGEADLSRKRRKEVVDRAAAAYILQGALDLMGR